MCAEGFLSGAFAGADQMITLDVVHLQIFTQEKGHLPRVFLDKGFANLQK